jgi:hypothetical protein
MLVLLSLLACVKVPTPSLPSASPGSNVWLRSSFDADASSYVGRFVPQGTKALDESAAMPLACSRFITSRFVDGGGVKLSETFQASTEVSARLGVPTVGTAGGTGAGSQSFRVEYTLTGKLIAEVSDPEAFAACCKAQPDQCSDRFIGEFLQGTGTVYNASSRAIAADAKLASPASGVGGDGALKNTQDWQKAVEFPNPVFFAFKVTKTPYNLQASACPAWVRTPPTTTDGLVIVGTSKESKSEAAARKAALSDAQRQLAMSTGAMATDAGPDGGAGLQTKEWCVETRVTDVGDPRWIGHVLVSVPQVTIDSMRRGAAVREAQQEREIAEMRAAASAAVGGAAHGTGHATAGIPVAPATRATPTGAPAAATAVAPTPPVAPGGAMTDADVSALVGTIGKAAFSSDKLAALRAGAAGRPLTATQAASLLRAFPFSADQLEALRALAPGLTDRRDTAPIVAVFTFSTDKDKAAAILR